MNRSARPWTWGLTAVAVVIALLTEMLLFYKALACGIADNNPDNCDGLRGGGETLVWAVLVAVPLAALIALVGGWKQRRSLALVSLAGLVVACTWVLLVGSSPLPG